MSTVRIAFGGSDRRPEFREVEGERVGRHFAIHHTLSLIEGYKNKWNVTHLPTGRALFSMVKDKRTARRIAQRMVDKAKETGLDLSLSQPSRILRARGFKKWAELGRELRTKYASV